MEVLYKSTRSNGSGVKASTAILKGLSDDGGLFVPDHIPELDKSLGELAKMTYQEVTFSNNTISKRCRNTSFLLGRKLLPKSSLELKL